MGKKIKDVGLRIVLDNFIEWRHWVIWVLKGWIKFPFLQYKYSFYFRFQRR